MMKMNKIITTYPNQEVFNMLMFQAQRIYYLPQTKVTVIEKEHALYKVYTTEDIITIEWLEY